MLTINSSPGLIDGMELSRKMGGGLKTDFFQKETRAATLFFIFILLMRSQTISDAAKCEAEAHEGQIYLRDLGQGLHRHLVMRVHLVIG